MYHTNETGWLSYFCPSRGRLLLAYKGLFSFYCCCWSLYSMRSHSINNGYMGEGTTRDIDLRNYWVIHPSQPQQNTQDINDQSATTKAHQWAADWIFISNAITGWIHYWTNKQLLLAAMISEFWGRGALYDHPMDFGEVWIVTVHSQKISRSSFRAAKVFCGNFFQFKINLCHQHLEWC